MRRQRQETVGYTELGLFKIHEGREGDSWALWSPQKVENHYYLYFVHIIPRCKYMFLAS